MTRYLFIFLVLFNHFFCHFANASFPGLALYLGGGGEASNGLTTTSSDFSFQAIQGMENRGWRVEYLFDGSHSQSQAKLKLVGGRGAPFTLKNTRKTLDKLENILADQKFPVPDELLLIIDTHGGASPSGSYVIATDDGEIDIRPQLLRIRKLAKARGVRLGIVNSTCYSGSLLWLGDENTCVISSAPNDTVGFFYQNWNFAEALGKGVADNLESLHIKTRNDDKLNLSQPQISTDAGKATMALLKPLRHLLIFNGRNSSELYNCDPFAAQNVERNLRAIHDHVLRRTLTETLGPSLKTLRSLSEKFTQYYHDYGALAETVLHSLSEQKCTLVQMPDHTTPTYCFYTTANVDVDALIEQKWILLKKVNEKGLKSDLKESLQAELNQTQKSIQMLKLVQKSPEYLKQEKLEGNLPPDLKTKLAATSLELGKLEREMYNRAYLKFREQNKGPNSCSQFEL